MSPDPRGITALITHARHVPSIERQQFAARLRVELAGRAVVLETCHRVEAYVVSTPEPARIARDVALPAGGLLLGTPRAVRHAIAVAVGRDSVVLGEDQVLHQLRETLEAERAGGALDPVLERLFAVALQMGRRARSWRQGPQRSLADVALSAIERQAGPVLGTEILVVGAGRMGRLAARAAVSAGASVSVANRSIDAGRALAVTVGGRLAPFDPGPRAADFAGVIVAIAGPWPIGPATIDALVERGCIVIDLSVPAAVAEPAAAALGPRLISADALALAEGEVTPDEAALHRIDALVDRATVDFLGWLDGRAARGAAEALVQHADREREAELAALWQRLPDLEPEARQAIDQMARHLARRLFREPLRRLGRDTDGRDEQAVRDMFAL